MADEIQLDQTTGIVERLKAAVEEFAGREEELERDFHLGTHRGREQFEEESEKLNAELTARLEAAEQAYKTEKKRIKTRRKNRDERIDRGHKAARNRLQRSLAEQEGHRVYELQMAMMQTNREVIAGRERAYKVNAEFAEQFEPDQRAYETIREKARKAFRGYGTFVKRLDRLEEKEIAGLDLTRDEYQLVEIFRQLLTSLRGELGRFRRKNPLAIFFSSLPLPVWLILVPILGGGAAWLAHQSNPGSQDLLMKILGGAGGLLLLILLLWVAGQAQANKAARAISLSLEKARRLHDTILRHSESRLREALSSFDQAKKETTSEFDEARKQTPEEAAQLRESLDRALDDQKDRALSKNKALFTRALEQFENEHADQVAGMKAETEEKLSALSESLAGGKDRLGSGYEANWEKLEGDWKAAIEPIYETVAAAQKKAAELFPKWDPENWSDWTPPKTFAHAAKFGEIHVDVSELCETVPASERLALPGPSRFALPLSLTFPEHGSILLETNKTGRETMIEELNTLMLRLLSNAPAGKLSFTLIDPVGLGESFSGIMHLADYDESLINNRIWTQTAQIEKRLADLNEHMEKVIQMYLRNEYSNITDYNKQAGDIAEKYHFIVVADFPANFSDVAAKRLMSIVSSGSRCGVYSLIHWDRRKATPTDFVPDEIREKSVRVIARGERFAVGEELIDGAEVVLEPAPDPDFSTRFIHRIGELSKDAYRVEVPFTAIAPPDDEIWSSETTRELQVPIGRTGATKFQYLAIGRDTKQHALIAGKTGSGKSTLFHVMVTNLALWCSPDQVEFYLVDFKKGVEFKSYATARLPHAKVIAIESDREFGLSVLQRVDDELKRRGDLYRKLGVQDVAGYKESGGTEPMPRVLLLIDEFQELFVEDDRISQDAAVLMDRIVRQGRAFGIHVILGSQTLGGAYTLARTTLGQMVIRIALQCNEADAYLIMDDSNPAPRLLSRPGEGIYNDSAGMIEGNSPFQVVWLPEKVRVEMLDKVRKRADRENGRYPDPIVFEGNAPADIHENTLLGKRLTADAIEPVQTARIWLGAPNSIKGPTEAAFKRQSGNNLLIVGQRDEAALAILSLSLICLGTQFPKGNVRFVLFDGTAPETPQRDYIDRIVAANPHTIERPGANEIGGLMNELVAEMETRSSGDQHGAPPIFVIIHDLQKYKKLRYEEDFSFSLDADEEANPGTQLDKLINEGASHGIHVIASCDTLNNVNRSLSRKALSEFEMRVVFQMSANDSASLIDSPKAGTLGLHRALFYNEQEGYLETFRPYALPDNGWIEETAKHLDQLVGYKVS